MSLRSKEIQKLKGQYCKYYNLYMNRLAEYDCGVTLAEEISGDLVRWKYKINEIVKKLRLIDTTCPLKEWD